MRIPWVPILCYHRICPQNMISTDSRSLCVTPEQFKRQISLLKFLGYRPISVQDLVAFLQARKNLDGKPVILTFDDGYEDNYIYAFPILKKFSFSATIFLVTDLIGKKNLWDSGTAALLNESQIEEMHLAGIGFGSHTAAHIDLSRKKLAEIKEELSRSKRKIEALTSRLDTPFCYPYSRLHPSVKTLLRECGYACAFAGDTGPCNQAEDLFELMRLQIFPSNSLFDFWRKIQPWYPRWFKRCNKS